MRICAVFGALRLDLPVFFLGSHGFVSHFWAYAQRSCTLPSQSHFLEFIHRQPSCVVFDAVPPLPVNSRIRRCVGLRQLLEDTPVRQAVLATEAAFAVNLQVEACLYWSCQDQTGEKLTRNRSVFDEPKVLGQSWT